MTTTGGDRDGTVTDEVLAAYLDGELDEVRRTQVEAYLAANPQAAEFVEHSARISAGLHRLFDRRLHEPLPSAQAELGLELERQRQRQARAPRLRRVAAVAACVLLVATAAGVGWQQLSSTRMSDGLFAYFQNSAQNSSANQAEAQTAAAEDPLAADKAVTVAQGDGEASGTDPGSGAGGKKSGAPDLSGFGFNLISTRLLAKNDTGSMQFIYESQEGARVELFYSASGGAGAKSLTLMERVPISLMFWNNEGYAYSLIGEVNRDTLLEMGKAVNGEWTVNTSGDEHQPPAKDDSSGTASEPDEGGASSTPTDEGSGGASPAIDGTVTPEEAGDPDKNNQKET